jgi:FG-GAP-like repeat
VTHRSHERHAALLRLGCIALSMPILAACGPTDRCQVPDESCADEPGFYRVCVLGSSGHIPFGATGNDYVTHECPGIEPVCLPVGERGYACDDAKQPSPCRNPARNVLTASIGASALLARVLDFDADQRRDLLFQCRDERSSPCGIWLSKQTAEGEFAPPTRIVDRGAGLQHQEVGDVNGDGRPDLVVEWGPLPGSFDPTGPPPPHALDVLLGGAAGFGPAISRALDGYDRLAEVRDVDADARAEVILMTGHGAAVLAFADDRLLERTRFEIDRDAATNPYASPTSLRIGDFDGTGRPYFIVDLGTGYQAFRADGADYVRAPEGDRWLDRGALIVDFDGDGASDILRVQASAARPRVSLQTSNRDGTFASRDGETLPYGAYMIVGDVDGDGLLDGVALHGNGRLTIVQNDGGGALRAPRTFEREAGRPLSGHLADLDGDGSADLVEAYSDLEPGSTTVRMLSQACL